MDGLGTPVVPVVAIAPPSVVQHQTADWSVVRADNVEGVRHEAFDYELKATSHHLLVVAERAEWYDRMSGLSPGSIRDAATIHSIQAHYVASRPWGRWNSMHITFRRCAGLVTRR